MVEVFVSWEMICFTELFLQQEKDPGHGLQDEWKSERLREWFCKDGYWRGCLDTLMI
jgi:hypothetical protein